jgi:hypothetical protein
LVAIGRKVAAGKLGTIVPNASLAAHHFSESRSARGFTRDNSFFIKIVDLCPNNLNLNSAFRHPADG